MAIVSAYNGGDVKWYHVHPDRPSWVVPCPTLELILVWQNLKAIGHTPTIFDAIRVSGMDLDVVDSDDCAMLVSWFSDEIIAGLPLDYSIWLTFVYELSGQKISPTDIDQWGRQPLRQMMSCFDLMLKRKEAEIKASKA